MKRHIDTRLNDWFQLESKKPLIIKGARQVGKTFSIRKFAQLNYKEVIEINFEMQLEFVDLFKRTRNPKDILEYLKLTYLDKNFNHETVLFLDEIQACPDALTSLKFMSTNFPTDIICSGSLLGVAISESTSFPVGYVETWDMNPLSFTEFLWALDLDESLYTNLENSLIHRKALSESIHLKMNDFFRDYLIVGGMPEVVSVFLENKSYREALIVQRRIHHDYFNDMAKYASGSDRIKTRECFESIPIQLAKDNKKFQYSVIKRGYNARYFESSLRWLVDSGLIIKVNRVSQILNPIEAYKELEAFKIYMADTGLLVSQFDDGTIASLLKGDLGVYKGAIYENITAQMLHSFDKEMYYFEPSNNSEIDFIINYEGQICPIEVKSSTNTHSISFSNFINKYSPGQSIRISTKNVGYNDDLGILYIPYYLFEVFLKSENEVIF